MNLARHLFRMLRRYPRSIAITLIGVGLWLIFLSPWHVAILRHESVAFSFALWTEDMKEELQLGEYVLVRWEKEDPNGIGLEKGMVLTKRIGCSGGMKLSWDNHYLTCNGKPFGLRPVEIPLANKSIAPFPMEARTLKAGELFLIGDIPRSYDSRYLGLFHQEELVGRVILGI